MPFRISVVIPFYKGLEYLRKTLNCVFAQDFLLNEMEIIISVDNGDENVRDILKPDEVKHIEVIEHGHLGMVGNWNFCLQQGTAPFIYLLHADDQPHPQFVSTLLSLLNAYPNAGLVHCNSHVVDINGNILSSRKADELSGVTVYSAGTDAIRHFIYEGVNCSSIILRRKAVLECGLFNPAFPYSTDEEYWPRLAAKWDVIHVHKFLLNYIMHEDSTQIKTWVETDFWESFVACSRERLNLLGKNITDSDLAQFNSRLAKNAISIFWRLLENGYSERAHFYRVTALKLCPEWQFSLSYRVGSLLLWNRFVLKFLGCLKKLFSNNTNINRIMK